jgi:hypothetical protein
MAARVRLRWVLRGLVRFRFVLFLVAVLLVLDVLVRGHAHRWRAYDPVLYRERLDACRRGQWDVVVVGGSPVMCGIDTDLLAGARWQGRPLERCFNLGLPLATTAEIWHAVEHGVTRRPRLLLYGITVTDLNGSRLEPNGPRQLMSARDLARWARMRPDALRWGLSHHLSEHFAALWSLSYYRDGVRLWAADRFGSCWPGLCPEAAAEARQNLQRSATLHSARGLTATRPVPLALRLSYLKESGQPLPPFGWLDDYQPDGYLPYLHRLFDWCERQGVPVVLVNMPAPADLEERLHPRECAAYRVTLAREAAERGVRVLWPTREAVGLTDADFSDLIHLNGDGATRLSLWIRRAIEQL